MKRFILVIILLGSFTFISHAVAFDSCNGTSPVVPCTYGATDYDSYFTYHNPYVHSDSVGFFNVSEVYLYLSGTKTRVAVYCGGCLCGCLLIFDSSFGYYLDSPYDLLYGAANPHVDLTVLIDPEAGGTVAVNEVSCQSCPCQYEIALNDDAVTEATPTDSNWSFVRWEWNDGANSSTNNPETFTMSQAMTVKAVFKPLFAFPLDGYVSTTVPISAVMDHSLSGGYYTGDGRNYEIKTFNDLVADGTEHSYGGGVYCHETTEEDPFPDLNYIGGSEICYDEHAGYDFAIPNGTNVVAPFDGKLYWATTDPVNGSPGTFGTFYIDHENGYTSWFLHCSGLTQTVAAEVQQNGFAVVDKGQHIAESGNQGTSGYHLHYEVRKSGIDDEHVIDPYKEGLWE